MAGPAMDDSRRSQTIPAKHVLTGPASLIDDWISLHCAANNYPGVTLTNS